MYIDTHPTTTPLDHDALRRAAPAVPQQGLVAEAKAYVAEMANRADDAGRGARIIERILAVRESYFELRAAPAVGEEQ
jgi:hypothetical protein